MSFKKIGVIGAGTMGIGVTVDLVLHDIEVVLVDISFDILEKAKSEILNTTRFAPLLNKTAPKMSMEGVLEKIHFTTQINNVNDCEFIIENVSEKWDIKETVYKELDKICKPEVCFGVDTSCISITKVAKLTNRQDKVIGIHLMNPVYLKPCVEVIQGFHTSEESVEIVNQLMKQLGKTTVVVNDYPGFVSNRISHLFMNEAAFVVQDQVASPQQVDEIFKKCFNHKMGPLETADLIGLDTVVDSLDVLYESYQDSKFRCCPLLRKMVHAGNLGRKSGKGFYEYKKQPTVGK